jgi:hypothetical protein
LAEKVKIELLRQMPTGKKLQLVSDLIVTGRRLSLVGVRARFPEAGPEELRRRLSTLVLGADLASKVYGPEPFPPTL